MSKSNKADAGNTQPSVDDIIAKAHEEAKKIMDAATKGADEMVEAAKAESELIKTSTVAPAAVVQDQTKKHIKSLKVCAIKRGYANHRIYEPGDKFLYRYWSHVQQGTALVAVTEEKALGGWMVTADDPRFSKSKAELQDVRVAEADGEDVTLASEAKEDLNVL